MEGRGGEVRGGQGRREGRGVEEGGEGCSGGKVERSRLYFTTTRQTTSLSLDDLANLVNIFISNKRGLLHLNASALLKWTASD